MTARRGIWAFLALAFGWGAVGAQGAASLHVAWEVRGGSACSASGDTLLHCEVPEGAPASIVLTVSATPAQAVTLAPLAVPPGFPVAEGAAGWGTATARYVFTPPPGSAGRRVEIAYRAIAAGVASLDLKIVLDIRVPSAACSSSSPAAVASSGAESRLYWSADRPITWADFWASPPLDRDPHALARIAMALEYRLSAVAERDAGTGTWKARPASLTVTNSMERDRSWALPTPRTGAALGHEQRHFDLAEVYRRVLESALRGLVATGRTAQEAEQNLFARAEEVFRSANDRHSQVQARYDREADHGRDAQGQAEWDRRIVSWLLDPRLAP